MKTTIVIRNIEVYDRPLQIVYDDSDIDETPASELVAERNIGEIYRKLMPLIRSGLSFHIRNPYQVTVEDFAEDDFEVVVIPKVGPKGQLLTGLSASTEQVLFDSIRVLRDHGYDTQSIRCVIMKFFPVTWDDVTTVMRAIEGEG